MIRVEVAPGHHLIRGWLDAALPLTAHGLFHTLATRLPWETREARIFGRAVAMPRMICGFGAAYSYSGQTHAAAPMPAEIESVRDAIRRRVGAEFNSCLANLYRGGRDSIAWHSDDEPELGAEPTIASLSLGAPRRFAIHPKVGPRPRGSIVFVTLEHGDLLVMSGQSQAELEHSVPKDPDPAVGPRINLTFRAIAV